MSDEERRGLQYTFYEWEALQLAVQRVSLLPKNHPFAPYLPKGWMQGDRGTCVGHACAIWMQCNYYALTGDFPTPEEMAEALPDQIKDLKSCILVYDQWYRTVSLRSGVTIYPGRSATSRTRPGVTVVQLPMPCTRSEPLDGTNA